MPDRIVLLVVISIVLATFALGLISSSQLYDAGILALDWREVADIVTTIVPLAAILLFVVYEVSRRFFRFLNDPSSLASAYSVEVEAVTKELHASLDHLRSRMEAYNNTLNSTDETGELDQLGSEDREDVKQRVANVLIERKFQTSVQEAVDKRWEEALRQEFQTSVNQVVSRLGGEVRELGRRATVNLYIGAVISTVGLAALAVFIWMSKADIDADRSIQQILLEFGMRLSLVVILQVFAYFFLRLYRQSIYDIKIFQNEITNIQSRNVAVYVGQMSKDVKTLSAIALELAKTERNFILKKGESTVGLFHQEQDVRFEQAVMSQAERLLDRFSSIVRPTNKQQP